MAIVTTGDLAIHLALTGDMGDPRTLARLVEGAQAHIERQLGFKIALAYGGDDQEPVPEDLKQAVLMLAAHWFDNHEAAGEGMREIPFGVSDIVASYREYTF